MFLAELNGIELWGTDILSAYLEAYTKEKLYVTADPEFGELQGHTLIVTKALYGLRTSGARWAEVMEDSLRDLGWFQRRGIQLYVCMTLRTIMSTSVCGLMTYWCSVKILCGSSTS